MKIFFALFALLSICSCGPSYCDACVETEHTITSSTGLKNLSIYSSNIVSEYNTFYKIAVEHDSVDWTGASIIMHNKGGNLINLNEGISLDTDDYYTQKQSTILTIPMKDISENGAFPEGEVFFEGTLSSTTHKIVFTGSTHFYRCETIIEDFIQDDCRHSCQIGVSGYEPGNTCSSQQCPF